MTIGLADDRRKVHTFRGTSVHIHRASPGPAPKDGDPFQAGTDLHLHVTPSALNVVVPRSKLGKV